MAILNFFKKHPPVLFRCTHCLDEKILSRRQVRLVAKLCPPNPVCPLFIPCPACHSGVFIPVDYTDDHGNHFLFDQLKRKINNPDPATITDTLFIDPETHTTFSFKFED